VAAGGSWTRTSTATLHVASKRRRSSSLSRARRPNELSRSAAQPWGGDVSEGQIRVASCLRHWSMLVPPCFVEFPDQVDKLVLEWLEALNMAFECPLVLKSPLT
jgi:hypothetical protein